MALPDDLPRWRCGERECHTGGRWQPVRQAGPDDLDAASAALDAHYTAAHPDLDVEEVNTGGHALAA